MPTRSSSLATAIALAWISRSASASVFPRQALESQGGNFQWTPCFSNSNTECAVFKTPLDYANPSAGNASLAVIRYKATKSPRLGTLWTNPGGPGGSGISAISSGDGELISNITGGYYDIASWDPRGVNNTLPRIDCFANSDEEAAFWNGTIAWTGLEAKGNFTNQADLDAFYAQAPEIDTLLEQLGERCMKLSGDNMKYVGSAAVVRDMVAMTDALDGPNALVNYWGFSYGTIIGAYFVNMFPNRVGRVVIDGVVNPELWANAAAYKGWGDAISDTDKVLHAFTQACADAGRDCVIASQKNGTKNATQIYDWILDFLAAAYDANKAGLDISSSEVRSRLHGAMYAPRSWDLLAQWLANKFDIVAGSPEFSGRLTKSLYATSSKNKPLEELEAELREAMKPGGSQSGWDVRGQDWATTHRSTFSGLFRRDDPVSSDVSPDYSFQAITCADAPDANYTTKDVFDELVRVTQQVSQVFGPQWGDATLYCHRWPARAAERFTGPWNHTLANPILVIGNDADPITPLHDAKYVADQLGDSAVLIEQEGSGHTSLAMHSNCTIQALSTYFISGQLPPQGDKQCAVNQPLFSFDEDVEDDGFYAGNITAVPEGTAQTTNSTGGQKSEKSSAAATLPGGVFRAILPVAVLCILPLYL